MQTRLNIVTWPRMWSRISLFFSWWFALTLEWPTPLQVSINKQRVSSSYMPFSLLMYRSVLQYLKLIDRMWRCSSRENRGHSIRPTILQLTPRVQNVPGNWPQLQPRKLSSPFTKFNGRVGHDLHVCRDLSLDETKSMRTFSNAIFFVSYNDKGMTMFKYLMWVKILLEGRFVASKLTWKSRFPATRRMWYFIPTFK